MTPTSFLIIESILAFALIILAIVAYRLKRTIGFLLLMLASLCNLLPRVAPFAIGLFFQIRGWKTSGPFVGWFRSWGYSMLQAFDFLFLGLLIAALAFFIREARTVTPQA